MVLGGFLFGSSSSTTPTSGPAKPPASSSSSDSEDSGSNTSRAGDSLLPPISTSGSMDLNLLTPATSTFTDLSTSESISSAKAETSTPSTTVHSDTRDARNTTSIPDLTPPKVTYPYSPASALLDLPAITYALELFLNSKMLESEEFCDRSDQGKERLYFSTGYGLIQCVKGLMSYEDPDLISGIAHTRQANNIADKHRKKQAFLGSRLAGYVVSTLQTSSISFIKSMTDVERHAELMYAESLVEKALLGIVYSGDWLAFVKEALNMRTTITIYRQLGAYLDAVDAEAQAKGLGPTDPSIDAHFRSGVYLGVGTCNIILSLMPGKLATLVELFGYKGDRKLGLETLMKAGGWVEGEDEPRISAAEEGLRRPICDMILLIFHLVLSSFTFEGVDITVADKILKWNLKRYPNGVFFLFGAGRLALCRSQPNLAINYYTQAMSSQVQYRNLHHISYWEIALSNLALWDIEASLKCWKTMEEEATWSKAIYSYGVAVCLLELVGKGGKEEDKKRMEEAIRLMDRVPGLRQKIAGKSIPMEKFVARKARKFQMQGNELVLPGLELAYLFMGIAHAPRKVITDKMLPEIDQVLAKLDLHSPTKLKNKTPSEKDLAAAVSGYRAGKGGGYWDDLCLALLLKGVCMRYLAYPDPDAVVDPSEEVKVKTEDAARMAKEAFGKVFEYGPRIELDHHLVYHAHYELGRLLACLGDKNAAKAEFELVLSGKYLEVGPSGRKGKYSMENALHVRTHAANDALMTDMRL